MNEKMRSCVMGLILGQFSSPLPMAQKEPVAYLYRTRAMSYVTYNDVEHPVIETRWYDKETYPYAFIYRYSGDLLVMTEYLVLCQTAPYYDSSKNAVCVEGQFNCYSSAIGIWSETTHGAEFKNNKGWGTYWASDNILHKDSTDIYLEGSEPVVVFTDAEYFVDGIGYKDMVLPKLPVWDKEKYPNAVMAYYEASNVLVVYFLANPTMGRTAFGASSPYFLQYDLGDMEYRSKRANPMDDFPAFGEGTVLADAKTLLFDSIIWSGTDLYEPDGNLYIHGSDPIPVYE